MNKTKIEWTHRPNTLGCTWNPIHFKRDDGGSEKTGNMCTRISPGCKNCYASTLNQRWGNRLEFIAENLSKGHFYLDEKELQAPLRQKKPCTIFVGDMFDLFHEAIPDEMILGVFRMMGWAKQHVFQVLTKRAKRMQQILAYRDLVNPHLWPVPHVWCGVSVESQKYADERIPLLLQTPAAVRFLSVEPQLEAVDLEELPSASGIGRHLNALSNAGVDAGADIPTKIDWVICGGESGPGARPFNLSWAESLREQCKAAGVAFFMKQVGVNSWPRNLLTKDRKGGDPSEWPEGLRVREWPA